MGSKYHDPVMLLVTVRSSDTSGGILPTHIVARVVLARSARLSSQAVQVRAMEVSVHRPFSSWSLVTL